ncbi:hypothetical protein M885DRAFT_610414 [Pelagophyceae sp. CCMP2097]|nr:hypothetical protein M885DRAFT_610414 [Pelagophyceae sp. CCMP2097]
MSGAGVYAVCAAAELEASRLRAVRHENSGLAAPCAGEPRPERVDYAAQMVQLFLNVEGTTHTVDVDPAMTVDGLKEVIEDRTFIPCDLQRLQCGAKSMAVGSTCLEEYGVSDGSNVELLLELVGGGEASRYKKSTSKMRWKWVKKRTRRLQRKRRKMRQRAK